MGLFATGTSCLALVWVIGRSRVPAPPARVSPFMEPSMLLRSPLRTSVDESIGSETSPPGWWLSPGSRSKRRLVTGSQRAVGPALRRLAPYAYLFVIAMLAAGVHIARYTQFSPIDE